MPRPAKFDDDEILDRSMRVFWRSGWSATSVRGLEEALDLRAPSIYRRFGSKDGLAAAVIDRYVDTVIRDRIDHHLDGVGDPVANLEAFLLSAVTPVGSSGRLIGCLLTTMSLEAAELGDPARTALVEGLARIDGALRREVERAAAAGRLRSDTDAAHATVAAAMQGLMAWSRTGVAPSELQDRARAVIRQVAITA